MWPAKSTRRHAESRCGRSAAASRIWDARRCLMQAADERQALRPAGMARENSSSRLRVRYRTADVHRRFVVAQARSAIRLRSRDFRQTPSRASVSLGLDRVRTAARLDRKERFTALLHHVDAGLLRRAYFLLKRDAAAGVPSANWRAPSPSRRRFARARVPDGEPHTANASAPWHELLRSVEPHGFVPQGTEVEPASKRWDITTARQASRQQTLANIW